MLAFSGAVLRHHPKAYPQKIEWKFVAWTSSSWARILLPTPYEIYHENIMKIWKYTKSLTGFNRWNFTSKALVWNFTTRSAGVVASWGAQAVDALAVYEWKKTIEKTSFLYVHKISALHNIYIHIVYRSCQNLESKWAPVENRPFQIN